MSTYSPFNAATGESYATSEDVADKRREPLASARRLSWADLLRASGLAEKNQMYKVLPGVERQPRG